MLYYLFHIQVNCFDSLSTTFFRRLVAPERAVLKLNIINLGT